MFVSYFVTTRVGMVFYLNANQYDAAINYGKQYIQDIIETDFFEHLLDYTPDVLDMHNDIIDMFEFSCHQSGILTDDISSLLSTLRLPTN